MNNADSAARLYVSNDDEALLLLARDGWPSLEAPLPEGIGELCRFAAIRAVEMQRMEQYLWRARALTAAVMTGARDTAAGLLLQQFFAATARTLEAKLEGHENGHEQARLVLEEMKRLIPPNSEEWSARFGRLYHEKRAVSFLIEGAHPGGGMACRRRLWEAEREYLAALPLCAGGERSTLKVQGGLALVRYFKGAYGLEPTLETWKEGPLTETERIMSAAKAEGYRDVERWAEANVGVMARGALVGWAPYEVL